MANLLGFAAAGALAGAGAGLHEDAVARRNAVMQELRDRRNQAFQTSEREARQRFDEGQNEKTRTFQAGESEKTRSHQSSMEGTRHGNSLELEGARDENSRKRIGFEAGLKYDKTFADENDMLWERNGLGDTRPVVDPATGKQIKGQKKPDTLLPIMGPDGPVYAPRANAAGSTPANASTMKDQKMADEELEMQADAQARKEAASTGSWTDSDAKRFPQDGNRDKFIARRKQEIINEKKKASGSQATAQPAAPASTGAEKSGPPQPQSSAPPPQPAAASTPQKYPAAPRDPAQRTVGQVYQAPNGKLGEWTSNGWRMISP